MAAVNNWRGSPQQQANGRLPAAFLPLLQMGAFGAECGSGTVAGMDHRVIRKVFEHTFYYVSVEGSKTLRILLCVAQTAGKERIPGEKVGRALRVTVEQGHGAGSMSAELDGFEFEPARPGGCAGVNGVPVIQRHIGGNFEIGRASWRERVF